MLVLLSQPGCGFDASGATGGDVAGLPAGTTDAADSDRGPDSTAPLGTSNTSGGTGSTTEEPFDESDRSSTDLSTVVDPTGDSSDASTASLLGPILELSDAPEYDFGLVNMGSTVSQTFALSNVGDAEALAIAAEPLAPPFAFVGRMFPGTGGTCTETLDPDDACTIAVAFHPVDLGGQTSTLVVNYAGGERPQQVAVAFQGGGQGTTANLLVNGDGESGGDPPLGWTEVEGMGWVAGDDRVDPHAGTAHLSPGFSPGPGTHALHQRIDLTQWADLIDAGELQLDFSGWTRAWANGNNDHRIEAAFLDPNDTPLDTFSSPWDAEGQWQEITAQHLIPPSARTVLLALECELASGSYCDGFFDDLVLTATYPSTL